MDTYCKILNTSICQSCFWVLVEGGDERQREIFRIGEELQRVKGQGTGRC